MSNAGNVLVVRGDIAQCQSDALVFSTSVDLVGDGYLHSSFRDWPGFTDWYDRLGRHGPRKVGDVEWLPPYNNKRGTPGIVLVCSVGRNNPLPPAAQAAHVLRKSLELARDRLSEQRPDGPWLVLVPALLTGRGGGHKVRRQIAESVLATAAAFVAETPQMDVAFVMYSPASYALYRQARRECVPLHPPDALQHARELTTSVQRGECVLFVGSGISAAAGMPGWDALIRAMAREANLECTSALPYEEKLAIAETYRQVWKERNLPDVATVAYQVFGAAPPPTLSHYLLAQLGSRVVVTTNYDRLLENTWSAIRAPYRRITSAHDVPASSLSGTTQVLKLHGDAAPPANTPTEDAYRDIVLSTEDYKTFPTRRAAFDLLLGALMLNHTFLFVGYSVSDENVRETWDRILKAINQHPTETGKNRLAFGLEFQRTEKPVPGLRWLPDTAQQRGDGIAESVREQWRLLDALAEHVEAPAQMLAPDAPTEGALARVAPHLRKAAEELAAAVSTGEQLSPELARTAARIAELLYELGWRPADGLGRNLWAQLASAVPDGSDERQAYLDQALAHSSSAREVAHVLRSRGNKDTGG